jgi:hypothetical protein
MYIFVTDIAENVACKTKGSKIITEQSGEKHIEAEGC